MKLRALLPTPANAKRRRLLWRSGLALRKLKHIAAGEGTVLAGPWTGDPGFELLYWIPLLRWLREESGLDPSRVIAVSRAGADIWYAGVAGNYVDLVDHYPPAELAQWQRRQAGEVSREADPVGERLRNLVEGGAEAAWLHPSLMYTLFEAHWRRAAPANLVTTYTTQRPVRTELAARPPLPQRYAAVRVAFSRHFPDTPDNRRFLHTIVADLGSAMDVVLLPGAVDLDELGLRDGPIDAASFTTPRNRLAVYTMVAAHAECFFAPYGGLSYLGPYVGTPTIALYSRAGINLLHLDAIERASRILSGGVRGLFRARHVGSVESAGALAVVSGGGRARG